MFVFFFFFTFIPFFLGGGRGHRCSFSISVLMLSRDTRG